MSIKSTTVRFMMQVGYKVAPAHVEAKAAELFMSPRRREPRAPALRTGREGTRGVVRSGNSAVAFYSFGEGPAVLLVHGWEGRPAQLVAFAEPLVQLGYRAIFVDLPAHGYSTGRQTSVVASARALQDLAQLVGPVKGVIAHSFGGAAAVLAQVERPFAERMVALAPLAEPGHYVRKATQLLGLPDHSQVGLSRQIEARVGRSFDEVDLSRHARALRTPLLVMHDPDDEEVPYFHGEAVANVSSEGVVLPAKGAGHWRILKDAAVISRAVEFLTGERVETVRPADAQEGRLRWENRSGTA